MASRAGRQRGGVADLVGSLLLVATVLLAAFPAASLGADEASKQPAADAQADPVAATYRATTSPSAVSPTGVTHQFVVRVEQHTDTGWEPVSAGTTASVSATDTALVATDGCAAGTGDDPATSTLETHVCVVTVASASPAIVTIGVEQVTAPDGEPTAVDAAQSTATHEWVAVSVDVEVDALVRVRDEHPVTVQGTILAAAGRIAPLPDGTIVEAGWSGPAGSTVAGAISGATCTITAGTCYLDLRSASPGTGVLTLTRVSFPWAGDEVVIDLAGEVGLRDPAVSPGVATVTWVAFRGEVGPDGRGVVGDRHTMTARFSYTTDGETWLPVPDGSTARYDVAGRVGAASDDGCGSLVDATCRIEVVSAAPGTLRVTLSSLSVFVPWVLGPSTQPPDGEGAPGAGPIVVGADRQGVTLTTSLRPGTPGVMDEQAPVVRSAVMTWAAAAAAIGLELQPVVGGSAASGDLTYAGDVDGTGMAGLEWSPSSADDKVAVFEYLLTNLGDVTLTEVALFDDRIGVILDGTEGVTLAPGESTSLRASELFTMLDAVEVLAVRTATATAVADGVEVSAEDTATIWLQAVLGSVIVREPTDGTVTELPDDESGGIVNGADAAASIDRSDELAATGLGNAGLLLPTSLGLLLAGLLVLWLERRRLRSH